MPVLSLKANEVSSYFDKARDDEKHATSSLAAILGLPDYQHDARSAIKLDYVAYVLKFAQDMGYGPQRTASLLTIADNLLQATAEGATFENLEASFKAALLKLTSLKPGSDTELFSPDQVARIAQFFTRTFFRHFKLYAHVFSTEQELIEGTATLLVETAAVPSFEGALPEDEWRAAQEAQQAALEAQAAAEKEAKATAAAAAAMEKLTKEAEEAERRRQEELSKKPATLEEAINHLVAVRLEEEKKVLAAEYAGKTEVLMSKISELEARRPPTPPATTGARGR